MNRIRQERIKKHIESRNIATIKELRELFPEVSLMTLHRDLSVLEEMGIITKYRGGVRSVHQPDDVEFNIRMKENNSGKMSMMKKAMKLLHPQSSIFLDASTSNLILARNLPDMDLNITTISPNIALELCRLKNPTVNLCGGTMNPRTLSVSGVNTLDLLEKINIDLAFISPSGLSLKNGFTSGNFNECELKKTIVSKAREVIMLLDAAKFEKDLPYTFRQLKDIHMIITNTALPAAFMNAAAEQNVKIIIAN